MPRPLRRRRPPPSSGGGGRRRRSGRGITVNDLTGDLPQVREGASAHAAPDHDEPAAPDTGAGYAAPPGGGYAAGPDHSPLSGPITFYNPLAPSSHSITEAPSYDYQAPDYGAANYGLPS